jgi:hypothetical protein
MWVGGAALVARRTRLRRASRARSARPLERLDLEFGKVGRMCICDFWGQRAVLFGSAKLMVNAAASELQLLRLLIDATHVLVVAVDAQARFCASTALSRKRPASRSCGGGSRHSRPGASALP